MKKILFLLLSLACFNLGALEISHFQSLATVTPTSNENEFLVEVCIGVMVDDESAPIPVACPKMLCLRGHHSEVCIGSEDEGNFMRVQALIPKDTDSNSALVKLVIVQNGIVVASIANGVVFNHSNP